MLTYTVWDENGGGGIKIKSSTETFMASPASSLATKVSTHSIIRKQFDLVPFQRCPRLPQKSSKQRFEVFELGLGFLGTKIKTQRVLVKNVCHNSNK